LKACGLGLPKALWQSAPLAILLPLLALPCNVIFEGLRPRIAKGTLANRSFGDPSPIISFILFVIFEGLRPRIAKVPLANRPFGDPSPVISFIL